MLLAVIILLRAPQLWEHDGKNRFCEKSGPLTCTRTKISCPHLGCFSGRALLWSARCSRESIYFHYPRVVREFRAYENALGVKSAGWSPSGKFLALGSFDEQMRVLNHLTWRCFGEYSHDPRSHAKTSAQRRAGAGGAVCYREEPVAETASVATHPKSAAENAPDAANVGIVGAPAVGRSNGRPPASGGAAARPPMNPVPGLVYAQTAYRVDNKIAPLRTVRPAPAASARKGGAGAAPLRGPKMGVGILKWSACGRWVATRNDNVPNAAWIWDMARLRLAAVLEHQVPVLALAWFVHALV
jgi:hypothetical protein